MGKNFRFKKTLLVGSLATIFAFGLTGCSEEAAEPLSSNSGEGVSAPAPSQPSAADVKQPEPMASVVEPMAEKMAEVKTEAKAVVKETVAVVEEKVEAVVAAVAAPKVKSGKSAYASCVGCHGAGGEGGVGPKLSGQTQSDIVAKLTKYKAGEQVGPMTAMMAPMAQNLSDGDIQVVAEYIAAF